MDDEQKLAVAQFLELVREIRTGIWAMAWGVLVGLAMLAIVALA